MSVLSFLKTIFKATDPNNYDTIKNYQILKADFVLMIAGVAGYKGTPIRFIFVKMELSRFSMLPILNI